MSGPDIGARSVEAELPTDEQVALDDQRRQAELQRMQRLATGLLALMSIVFFVSLLAEQRYPWMRFVRATAEAAMVGGVADWFAVTALFRHPLGLKIPHTAILPNRKNAMGESMGRFIRRNFLNEHLIAERVHSLQVARRIAVWLHDQQHSTRIAEYVMVIIAGIVQVARDEEVQDLLERSIATRLRTVSVAPFSGRVISLVLSYERRRELLLGALEAVDFVLKEYEEPIRHTIVDSKPWWLLVPIDKPVYQRLVALVHRLSRELHENPAHPLYDQFSTIVDRLVDNLRNDPNVIARGEALKEEMLAHPLVREVASSLWDDIKSTLLSQSAHADSLLHEPIKHGLRRLSDVLSEDEATQTRVNGWVENAARYVVRSYGHEAHALIAQTVRRWDPSEITQKLELQVGKELQYIRINGTIVGGLVGLLIAIVSTFVTGL